MKKVLIITYYWPPSGGPGVQRVLKFCKYLRKFGWEPIVLTTKDGDFPVEDLSFYNDTKTIDVHFANSLSFHKIYNWITGNKTIPTYQLSSSSKDNKMVQLFRWIRNNLIVPDGRIGWYPNAVKVGSDLIKQNNIRVIFSSAPPYTVHLIGRTLSKKYKIPWIADFRDPWTDRFYNYENKRLWITRMIDSHLENKVINDATALTTVSKTISKSYKKLFHVIHNGYDEDDFTAINKIKNNAVVIRYIGTMTKSQYPSIFFESINELNLNKKKYQIELIGNIHPDIKYDIEIKKYDNFIKIKPYIPHKEAIKEMCESRFLLLVIPNTQKNMGIVTGKLFEYIRSGSKILMIGPIDSDAAKIIHETNSGYCFDYNDMSNLGTILSNKNILNSIDYSHYSRVSLTKELVGIFNKTIKGSTNINV
jgi:glycosyltransferase involved in cell wall biosynthesis